MTRDSSPLTRRRPAASRPFLIILAALAVAPLAGAQDLLPLPPVPLEGVEPEVRAAIESRRRAVDAARADLDAGARATFWGELGTSYHAHELLAPAEVCYRNAQRLAPGEAGWHHLLALLRLQQGRYAEAAASFEAALARLPPVAAPSSPSSGAERLAVLLRLGEARLAAGETAAAFEAYAAALEIDASAPAAVCGLGSAVLADGDDREAAARLERCLELAPEATRFHAVLTGLYRRLGDAERARAHARSVGTGEVPIPDPWAGSLRRAAASGDALLERGAEAVRGGRFEAALAAYEEALASAPDDPRVHQALGSLAERTGDAEAAERHYREAIALDADDPLSHFNLASLLARRGDEESAASHFETALRLDPQDLGAKRGLALVSQRRGDLARAIELWGEILEVEPDNAEALSARGGALWLAGRRPEAARDLDRAAAVAPGDATLRARLGVLLLESGQLERAEVELLAAIELDPAPQVAAQAQLGLGHLRARQGRDADARRHFEAAIGADPDQVGARLQLATLDARSREYRAAAAHYRRVVERLPTHSGARVAEVAALVLAGDCAAARSRLEVAVPGEAPDAELALARVRLLSTCPGTPPADLRDALDLAQELERRAPGPLHAEAVAMALAANGRFDEAARLQETLLSGAAPDGARRRLTANLERYRRREAATWPWSEVWK